MTSALSPAETIAKLEWLITTKPDLGFDSEGQQWPTCLGFAWSGSDCCVVDCLALKDRPYAKDIWGLCRALLESPDIVKFVWNAPHERAFLQLSVGWTLRGVQDAMMAYHERFPELPKGLKYASSILTRLPCWTEGIHWGDSDDDSRPAVSGLPLWVYNAHDCCGTWLLAHHPLLAAIINPPPPPPTTKLTQVSSSLVVGAATPPQP